MHAMMTACSRLVRRPYVVKTRGQKHDRCSQSRYHSSRCTDVTKLCHRICIRHNTADREGETHARHDYKTAQVHKHASTTVEAKHGCTHHLYRCLMMTSGPLLKQTYKIQLAQMTAVNCRQPRPPCLPQTPCT